MAGTGRVNVVLSHPTQQQSLAVCFAVTFTVQGKPYEIAAERIRTGKGGSEGGLAIYVGVAALRGDGPLEIEACGERWSVPRERVAPFLSTIEPPTAAKGDAAVGG